MSESKAELPKAYVAPDIVLKLLINFPNAIAERKIIQEGKLQLVTDLFAIYEAVQCIEPKDDFTPERMTFLFQHLLIEDNLEKEAYGKMSVDRKKKLRATALGK